MGLRRTIKKIRESLIIKKINNADYNNLELMSYDIKNLRTVEKFSQNDFYYNAYHMKKYCGYNTKKALGCTIEHGADINDYVWELDLSDKATAIITVGDYKKEIISKKTDKPVYSIGPYIAYCKSFYSEDKIKRKKLELGKCLTVFPSHSTHWINVKYDMEAFCKEINRIKYEYNFDSVRVCMYWKDIINGSHEVYQKHGFKCVSAGHIYDKSFLPRLKSIILLSDAIISNTYGTYIAYSTYFNKPFYLFNQEQIYDIKGYKEQFEEVSNSSNKDNEAILKQLFGEYKEDVTSEQREFINKFFSPQNVKTKEELYNIFTQAENKEE